MEMHSVTQLQDWIAQGRPLAGLRLQDLDLGSIADQLCRQADLTGLVVLGGTVPAGLLAHLQTHGAVVFPTDHDAPVDVFRAHLYTGRELYDGLDGPGGYASTPDSRAYEWSCDVRLAGDAYASLLKAIHDDSISDALDEWVEGRRVVGVMGGHAAQRDSTSYAVSAHLGLALAGSGLLVATGGGPGAMEAANLGAAAPSADALEAALDRLRPVPSFGPDIGAWVRSAFAALDMIGPLVRPEEGTPEPQPESGAPTQLPRSLGVPTWFYGHEPPNVFAEGIAKYFSNAVREDGLLARSNAGVIVMPGAAGTVQEVFQLATPLFYASPDAALPPLVLVGVEHWTTTYPVWPLVKSLAAGRGMAASVYLVDRATEAAAIVAPWGPGHAPSISPG